MTLSRLHIRFPTCVVVPLGLDINLCVGTLWVSIVYRFLDLESTCDYVILISCSGLETISSARWEWAILVPHGLVVVLFHSYHLRSIQGHCVWSFPCWHLSSFYSWIILMDGYICDVCYIFYDGCYVLYDGCYSFMMMNVPCMVDGFIYFIALVSWIRWG